MNTFHARNTPCQLHDYHSPASIITVGHHVRPKSWGGIAGVNTYLAWICPTGHYNVHAVLDAMYRGEPIRAGLRTRQLAEEGWNSTPVEYRKGPTL